jgi:hypothetical protein
MTSAQPRKPRHPYIHLSGEQTARKKKSKFRGNRSIGPPLTAIDIKMGFSSTLNETLQLP